MVFAGLFLHMRSVRSVRFIKLHPPPACLCPACQGTACQGTACQAVALTHVQVNKVASGFSVVNRGRGRSLATMLSFAEQTEERRFQRWFSSRRYGPDLTWCLISALLCVCVQCERYFDVSEDIQMPLRMHWCGIATLLAPTPHAHTRYIRVVGVCRALPLIIGLVIRSKSYGMLL